MARLRSVLEDYLHSIGRLGPVHLGEADEPEARKLLVANLKGTATANNYLVIIATVCLCIVFVMAIFFAFY